MAATAGKRSEKSRWPRTAAEAFRLMFIGVFLIALSLGTAPAAWGQGGAPGTPAAGPPSDSNTTGGTGAVNDDPGTNALNASFWDGVSYVWDSTGTGVIPDTVTSQSANKNGMSISGTINTAIGQPTSVTVRGGSASAYGSGGSASLTISGALNSSGAVSVSSGSRGAGGSAGSASLSSGSINSYSFGLTASDAAATGTVGGGLTTSSSTSVHAANSAARLTVSGALTNTVGVTVQADNAAASLSTGSMSGGSIRGFNKSNSSLTISNGGDLTNNSGVTLETEAGSSGSVTFTTGTFASGASPGGIHAYNYGAGDIDFTVSGAWSGGTLIQWGYESGQGEVALEAASISGLSQYIVATGGQTATADSIIKATSGNIAAGGLITAQATVGDALIEATTGDISAGGDISAVSQGYGSIASQGKATVTAGGDISTSGLGDSGEIIARAGKNSTATALVESTGGDISGARFLVTSDKADAAITAAGQLTANSGGVSVQGTAGGAGNASLSGDSLEYKGSFSVTSKGGGTSSVEIANGITTVDSATGNSLSVGDLSDVGSSLVKADSIDTGPAAIRVQSGVTAGTSASLEATGGDINAGSITVTTLKGDTLVKAGGNINAGGNVTLSSTTSNGVADTGNMILQAGGDLTAAGRSITLGSSMGSAVSILLDVAGAVTAASATVYGSDGGTTFKAGANTAISGTLSVNGRYGTAIANLSGSQDIKTLQITNGGILQVDSGKVLTLGAGNTLNLNSGVLSFGVAAGDQSGRISLQGAAANFSGSNTLDLYDWVEGLYTVLESAAALNPANFKITYGGTALDARKEAAATLSEDGKTLKIEARDVTDVRNSAELAWNGGDSAWDYTTQNWLLGEDDAAFIGKDAALFSGGGSKSVALDGNFIELSGLKVAGDSDYALSGAALRIDSAGAAGTALDSLDYKDGIVKDGAGMLTLNTGGASYINQIANGIQVNDGILALEDGFAVERTGAYGSLSVGSDGKAPQLHSLGQNTLTNMNLQLIWPNPELHFKRPNSQIAIHDGGPSYLGQGIVDLDLNRDKTLAAFALTGSSKLYLSESPTSTPTLVLRHTGRTADSGSWLVVDGDFEGTFIEKILDALTLSGSLTYDEAGKTITFDGAYTPAGGNDPPPAPLPSPNAQNAWNGLSDAINHVPGDAYAYLYGLSQTDPAEYAAEVERIAPHVTAEGSISQAAQGLASSTAVASTAMGYAFGAAAAPAPSAGAASPLGINLWSGYLGNFSSQDREDGYAGYDAKHNGFLLGGSFDAGPAWTVGGYAGWTTGETDYDGVRAGIDTKAAHLGAFGRYSRSAGPGTLRLTGDLVYSRTDNDSRRTVPLGAGPQRMDGSFKQDIYGLGLELAYDWAPGGDAATLLSPFAAARYTHLEQDGYRENGPMALNVSPLDSDSLTTTLGFKAAREIDLSDRVTVTPRGTVGWLHQWGDRSVSTSSSFVGSPVTFMTRSMEQDRDALLLGAGLDVLVKRNGNWDLNLKANYGAEIRAGGYDQSVFAGFEIRF